MRRKKNMFVFKKNLLSCSKPETLEALHCAIDENGMKKERNSSLVFH